MQVSQNYSRKPRYALVVLSSLFYILVTLASFTARSPGTAQVAVVVKAAFEQDLAALRAKSARLAQVLLLLGKQQASAAQAQAAFFEVKKAYKRTEYLLEYLDPELAKKLNGAPIPKVTVSDADYLALGLKEPLFSVAPPEGFQVLEELLFADEAPSVAEAYALARQLDEGFTRLEANLQHQPLTDKQLLESAQEEVLRVMTMGITGFDAPGAGHEMELAATALEPVLALVQHYAATGLVPAAGPEAARRLQTAIAYLRQHPDFDSFNRLEFIRETADPAYRAVTVLQPALLEKEVYGLRLIKPVNSLAKSLFDRDFLRTAYYAKQDRDEPVAAQAALGEMLFFDPVLSSNNQRSCASCHHPAKAFTDGKARSVSFVAGETVARNAPTLLNAIYSTAYFWDSRAGFLEDQIPEVVQKPDELHSSYQEVVEKIRQSREYQKLFRQAFRSQGGPALNASNVNRAIAAYLRGLVSLDSPFDKYMRHETEVLSASARRGANLFMGKAACATCHFAPIFNGTVPPRFLESEVEVIGVPANQDFDHAAPDPDLGRGQIVKAKELAGAFKTPTVRNAALTAPYMHNGVYNTLNEVIEFYNRGGGAGLGLAVPNQTLPFDNLSLNEQEKQDLVAFLESLTDSTAIGTAPGRLPAFPASTSLHGRPVGGAY